MGRSGFSQPIDNPNTRGHDRLYDHVRRSAGIEFHSPTPFNFHILVHWSSSQVSFQCSELSNASMLLLSTFCALIIKMLTSPLAAHAVVLSGEEQEEQSLPHPAKPSKIPDPSATGPTR
jgi:hypothetical protein